MTKQEVESGISRADVERTSSIRKQNRDILGVELWRGHVTRQGDHMMQIHHNGTNKCVYPTLGEWESTLEQLLGHL